MQVRNQRRWAVLRQQLEEMERRGAKLERRMTELQAQNELLRELQREQQEPALRAPIRRRAEGRSCRRGRGRSVPSGAADIHHRQL